MHIIKFLQNRPSLIDRRTGRLHYKRIFLIGLAVLGIAFMLPKLTSMMTTRHNTAADTAQQDMAQIVEGLKSYRKDNGMYPSAEQGLLALILRPTRGPSANGWKTGGYVDRLPRDPWGHSYQYRINETEQTYRLFSYGPTGPEAGEENDHIILAR